MANVNITLSAFMSMTDSKGEFKTWGDVLDGGYMMNLVNQEVYEGIFKAPEEIIGDNIVFEYTIFPLGSEFDKTGNGEEPVLNRVNFLLPTKKKGFNYKMDLFGMKTAEKWAFYIGQKDTNIWTQILNYNNTVQLNAVVDYSTATGQFKILKELSNASATKEKWFDDSGLIADGMNSIMATQTISNLGLSKERMSVTISPQIMRRVVSGLAGINVSQGAYSGIVDGSINNLFGYKWKESIYLGKSQKIMSDEVTDFTNILGVVYNVDSLGFYQQSPLATARPIDNESINRSWGWKPFAIMLPSREHTSFILVKTVPTIEQVNLARAKMLTLSQSAYANLNGGVLNQITDDEYAVMVTNASIFDFDPIPNIDVPTPANNLVDSSKTKK